jgi:hypothetical protein
MQVVLFTGNECSICHEVEEAFKKKYKDEMENEEADIVNLDDDEESQQFWMEHQLPLAPTMIVISDKEKIVCVLDPKALLDENESPKEAVSGIDKKQG